MNLGVCGSVSSGGDQARGRCIWGVKGGGVLRGEGRGWKKGMEFKISVEPGRWEPSRGVKFRGRVHAEGEGTRRGVELGRLNYMFGKYGSGMVLVKGAEMLRCVPGGRGWGECEVG